jgi:hypothetical protein
MKKSTYALCGSTMLIVAVGFRIYTDAGSELALLLIVGLTLLLASADMPTKSPQTKG